MENIWDKHDQSNTLSSRQEKQYEQASWHQNELQRCRNIGMSGKLATKEVTKEVEVTCISNAARSLLRGKNSSSHRSSTSLRDHFAREPSNLENLRLLNSWAVMASYLQGFASEMNSFIGDTNASRSTFAKYATENLSGMISSSSALILGG